MSGDRRGWWVAGMLVGAACGGDDGGSYCLCDYDEVCFRDGDRDVTCVPRCDTAPCAEGHACVTQGVEQVCEPSCTSELCGSRRECIGLSCQPVDCGFATSCLDDTTLCDPWVHRCYPFDGACTTAADCPQFDGRLATIGTIACDGAYCRIGPGAPPTIPGFDSDGAVAVERPTPGSSFGSEDELEIRWAGPDGHAIVLVLDAIPFDGEVLAHAVWGAVVAAGEPRAVAFADGRAIVDGAWMAEPGSLAMDRTLYVLVEVVEPDVLVAANAPVPFVVGHDWPRQGSPCADRGELAGSCFDPARLQGCHPVLGTCAAVCLSSRDCVDLGLQCGEPRDGVRYCE